MPDSNAGLLPPQSGALPMSHRNDIFTGMTMRDLFTLPRGKENEESLTVYFYQKEMSDFFTLPREKGNEIFLDRIFLPKGK